MLFDLRSRGRRRTVQVIYLCLAFLMLGGLVLFGVGAGNGVGGLLNAFTNNGSGNSQSSAVSQVTKAALKATRDNPDSASAWAGLVQARWTAAGQGSNYDTATSTYTTSGKAELTQLTEDWQRYEKLANPPNIDVAELAGEAYAVLEQYAGEASAWEDVVLAQPKAVKGYECLALAAYAAKQTRKANLAAAEAVKLAPKLDQLELKQEFTAAKTEPTLAQEC